MKNFFGIMVLLFGLGLVEIYSHDLYLIADEYYPESGKKINVKVAFGHNFPYYDIFVSSDDLTEFSFIGPDGQKKEITNTFKDIDEEKKEALGGEVFLNQKGTYLISASRIRKGEMKKVPSEKYAKAIIVAEKETQNFKQPLGHRIEIIPLKNPSNIKRGDYFPVKVLFEGKPLSTFVYATYAGFHSEKEPFPVCTKSNEKGVAYIKISQPGKWLVVCSHKVNFSATLTFEIKWEAPDYTEMLVQNFNFVLLNIG